MAGAAPEGHSTGTDASVRLHQLEAERRALAERAAQADRELKAAQAELELKDEYVAAVEAELEETLEFLRAKTAYIESLPWVRLRMWVAGRRQQSK